MTTSPHKKTTFSLGTLFKIALLLSLYFYAIIAADHGFPPFWFEIALLMVICILTSTAYILKYYFEILICFYKNSEKNPIKRILFGTLFFPYTLAWALLHRKKYQLQKAILMLVANFTLIVFLVLFIFVAGSALGAAS